ncbi:MAG TPA: enoyl-CoA hydratase/isomerase family protein [Acidimicrobiales bacterium]|nr:enoyl-CoA hydratase/isomerase family protein [Acidimicrobiales bacterium]
MSAHEVSKIYKELTDGCRIDLRVSDLVYQAAERHPDLLPTREEIDAERTHRQSDKAGLEIKQGDFISRVLADPHMGLHLMHAMSQPRVEALEHLDDFRRTGRVDLGPMLVERDGAIGRVTIQNHEFLNSEDDASTAAFETAVDLVLLDDAIEVGVLRGAPATHPKHEGRRIFGAGINLTHLYYGQISLVEFMIERELGGVSKMYRGHSVGDFDDTELEHRREKPWIAAVESFAIGGACQWLLVMDRVIAEQSSYFNLPARKEGIIPGSANLRLPRFVGENLTRQAIFFGYVFRADSPEGRMIAAEVVPEPDMDEAISRAAEELTSAGTTSLLANRKVMRAGSEPLDVFRRYMAGYAREQARCLYSPALIQNLERNWDARSRRL